MKLYGHPFSSNARRVQILCEECGIPYDYVPVDLLQGAQYEEEFLRLNPNAKVPVIDDDGFLLWESQAIMRYLADKYGATGWYPVDLEKRAVVDQWLDWNQTRLTPATEKVAYNTLLAGDKADQQAIASGKAALEKVMPILDGALHATGWMAEERPTLCDVAVATNVTYLELCKYDLETYPAVVKWYSALKERESFKTTAPGDGP